MGMQGVEPPKSATESGAAAPGLEVPGADSIYSPPTFDDGIVNANRLLYVADRHQAARRVDELVKKLKSAAGATADYLEIVDLAHFWRLTIDNPTELNRLKREAGLREWDRADRAARGVRLPIAA